MTKPHGLAGGHGECVDVMCVCVCVCEINIPHFLVILFYALTHDHPAHSWSRRRRLSSLEA